MKPGTIGWIDLTVNDAEQVRDFYAAVAGWKPEPVDMGGYADYSMVDAETGEARAGVCHTRGVNQDLPPVWLLYITVADLTSAVAQAQALGGAVLKAPAKMGTGWYAVVRDPAGAAVALYEAPEA